MSEPTPETPEQELARLKAYLIKLVLEIDSALFESFQEGSEVNGERATFREYKGSQADHASRGFETAINEQLGEA